MSNDRGRTRLERIDRRDMLYLLTALGFTSLFASSAACTAGSADGASDDDDVDDDDDTTNPQADSGGTTTPVDPSEWASGGTAAMTEKASYPDPFTTGLTACAIVARTTEGPCTTATELMREDISEGLSGLPVRLALQVVDASCTPLAGVTVKVWHTNTEGSYSGQTPNNGMCLKDQSYASNDFFRGAQVSDESGKVYFDTCFPGWYRGRAVHIHFQVMDGSTTYKVSQLFFPEDITEGIFASHSEYSSYGQPDTVFSNDNILSAIPSSDVEHHVLAVARMSDGAMLASKVVAVV